MFILVVSAKSLLLCEEMDVQVQELDVEIWWGWGKSAHQSSIAVMFAFEPPNSIGCLSYVLTVSTVLPRSLLDFISTQLGTSRVRAACPGCVSCLVQGGGLVYLDRLYGKANDTDRSFWKKISCLCSRKSAGE